MKNNHVMIFRLLHFVRNDVSFCCIDEKSRHCEARSNLFKTLFVALLWIFSSNITNALSEKKDSTKYSISVTFNQGAVLFDELYKTYLINDYAKGCEISLIRRRFQSDVWENNFNGLETGISLWFSTFGRSDILGEGIVLKTFANFRLFQLGKLNAKYQIAIGPTYVTKIYDINKNFYNFNFSTHLNTYAGTGFILNYPVSERLSLSGNCMLHHISNGSFKKPNNGVNILNIGLGLRYELNPPLQSQPVYQSKTPFKSREIMVTSGLGINQAFIVNPQQYLSGSVSVTHLWANKKKVYGLGMDFIHLGGAQFVFADSNNGIINYENNFSNNLFIGLYGTMESYLGSTAPYLTIGYYIYHKTELNTPLYARLGLRQKIVGNLSAHYSIKTGLFSSEFMEFGLAYRFKYKKY
jgi:hypothetical protein